jgi:hypothetical protein
VHCIFRLLQASGFDWLLVDRPAAAVRTNILGLLFSSLDYICK